MKQKKGIVSIILDLAAYIVFFVSFFLMMEKEPASLTSGDVWFYVAMTGVIPFCLGLAGLVLGVWALVKKQGKVAAVIGIIAALPVLCMGGFLTYAYCKAYSYSGMEFLKEAIRSMIEGGQQGIDNK